MFVQPFQEYLKANLLHPSGFQNTGLQGIQSLFVMYDRHPATVGLQ